MSEGQRARTEGSGGTRIYLEIGLMRCMGMTGRSGRELGCGPRVLQSSVLLQDIHPSIHSGRPWLEAGVAEAAQTCPSPPRAHGFLVEVVVQCVCGDEHMMITARGVSCW